MFGHYFLLNKHGCIGFHYSEETEASYYGGVASKVPNLAPVLQKSLSCQTKLVQYLQRFSGIMYRICIYN